MPMPADFIILRFGVRYSTFQCFDIRHSVFDIRYSPCLRASVVISRALEGIRRLRAPAADAPIATDSSASASHTPSQPDGAGGVIEVPVKFPVWLEPVAGGDRDRLSCRGRYLPHSMRNALLALTLYLSTGFAALALEMQRGGRAGAGDILATADITSRIAGRLGAVLIREGSFVGAGSLVARIDDPELILAVRQAEAAERLRTLAQSQPELQSFVDFLGDSERSIIR